MVACSEQTDYFVCQSSSIHVNSYKRNFNKKVIKSMVTEVTCNFRYRLHTFVLITDVLEAEHLKSVLDFRWTSDSISWNFFPNCRFIYSP